MKTLNQANRTFAIYTIVVSALLFVLIWSLFHQIQDVSWIPNVMNMIVGIWLDFRYGHAVGESLLAIVSLFTIASLIILVSKDAYSQYKWNEFIKSQENKDLTELLNLKYAQIGFPIVVLHDMESYALTSGMITPKIIISTGLLSSLSDNELNAVLLHETYHSIHYHPMKKWLLRRLSHVMTYVPILKGLLSYYSIWIELLADRYAIEQMRNKTYIASAIVKMINQSQSRQRMLPITADFGKTAINYRLKQVLDLQEQPSIEYCSKKALWLSVAVGILFTSIVIFSCS
ncbi:M56 family metallopeptidase [Paenibacillus alginolyticus]|uniref:M56 family metallopeptidase n=1 Tax=Paenibacillus alginolyticus TaxID=59839 RepID=A0ABT4GJE6_9BACL|nr:M56 family metallopeptidase [Paenibacillus alginolyticus]MCY9696153.1 M56 family metallopeptidase [Paenibacillus alginolyticus]MEC0143306.1 M56 family metallopeptidase [Paenibacillus alginolyticus]